MVVQWLTNPTRNHEVAVPALAQWVNDLVLPGAVVQVADAARILRCCGSGVGQRLQLRFDLQLGNLHMPQGWPKKWQKDEKKRRRRICPAVTKTNLPLLTSKSWRNTLLTCVFTLDLSSRWRCRRWLLTGHSYGRGNVVWDVVEPDILL